jgi:biotin transport system ATP-binding protein
MIEVQDVTHRFGQRQVLTDVTVTLREHRVAIIGANGSGKSTFARLLNGLQLPTSGRVLVDGIDTRTDGREVRRKVGFGFQNPDNQIVFPLVSEDLAFGMKNLGLPADVVERRICDVLVMVSHDLEFLGGFDRVLVFDDGRIALDDAPDAAARAYVERLS